MNTDNIFSNDILNGDLSNSLVPELGKEDISLNITPSESSFTDPLNQELSLIEPEIVIDNNDNNIGNNLSFNDSFSLNHISVSNIDPLTGNDVLEFQVNQIDVNDTFFAPPQSELQFQGGFGDYDGGNDVTFEVKNDDEVVVETYSLTGKGQASLYRDDEDGKAYIFFSGTDETTSVKISAKSNIQFDSYIGDSLKIETTGSIDAGSVTLNNPDETGLVLKSGIQGREENLEVLGYNAVHLGEGTAQGINNEGEVIVDGYGASLSFIYSNGEINYLGSDNSITPNGINDSGQVVGSFTNSDNNTHAFLYSNGSISDLGVLPGAETYEIYDGSGFVEVPYTRARSFGNAINNNGQIVGIASSKFSWGYDQFRWRAFISDGGSMTDLQNDLNGLFGYEEGIEEDDSYWFYASEAYGINDSGQVVGSHFYEYNEAFVYGGGQNINLHSLLGDDVRNSTAHDINNESQIIGAFNTRGSTYTGFVYNDGEIKTLGGSLFDINNNGIVAGSSGATATLYDIDNDTSINLNIDSTIDSEEAIWLSSARGINDKGQIAATGYFTGDIGRTNNAFLLNPQFAEPELDDYIKIGNITTFGDTVLLQGNEINLTGKAITTQGAEITFDGATTVNHNLIIDSFVTEDEVITDGGDITFTSTLDSDSAGTNNLRLQAGTGNILFGDTVGGEATLKNINVLGANTVTANADMISDQLVRINVTEDITARNVTAENGRVRLSSQQKSITALDITSGNGEGDYLILKAGDSINVKNLSANELGAVIINSGKYLEQENNVVGDITTESITGKGIRIESTGKFTATGDALAHDGQFVVNAKQDITTENVTANNGNVRLISEEKSITAQDIISGSETEAGNIVLKGVEGVKTVNLNAHELGRVAIKSGDVLEDDTLIIGSTITNSITGKRVDVSSTGGFTAIGDITAHDGMVTITTHDDIQTKKIESVTKLINLVSTDGEVTIDGELISGKGGISIVAKDDITTQKINSSDGVVGLSSFDGNVIVEDDITTVKGGVVIAGKAGVEVNDITTEVGEVNIGSAGDIDVNGNVSTDVGYIDIKTNASISAQGATTDKGFVSIAAGGVASANIATGLGTSTLVSVANLDDEILIAGNPDGNLSATVTRPQDLSDQEAAIFTEFVESTVYRARPLGEFVLGALYEWAYSNGDEIRGLMPGFLKLDERQEAILNARLNQSKAFELGRLLGEGAAVAQGIYEFIAGSAAVGGGGGLCITGIGCFAGAPAIATGVVLQAHGGTLAVNSASEFGEKLRDILSPNRMASSGGADDVIGLSRETGISQGSIEKVYGDIDPSDIKLVGNKLSKNTVEPLFNQGNKDYVKDVTESVKLVGDDLDAIEGIQTTLRNNKIPDEFKVEAFSELFGFLKKYKNKVSGEFAFRFGKANVPETAPLEIAKQTRGARGEIDSAIDILEGNTVLGNPKSLKAIPENQLPNGSTTPDFLITGVDDLIRLGEVKTPKNPLSKNNIKRNLKEAISSIKGSPEIISNNAYVRLNYKTANPTKMTEEGIFNAVKSQLLTSDSLGRKGINFVEYVDVSYKNSNLDIVNKLFKVENGILKSIQ